MFKTGKKSQETIGLDLGNYSIKVVSIKKEPGRNILTAYNIKKVPLNGNKQINMGKFVKEVFNEVDIRANTVNFAISDPNVIVRFINLPRMNKEQLEHAMAFEAERYIPFSVNEVIMDSIILDNADSGQMNVLLAVVKQNFLQPKIELLKKEGIEVGVIDVGAFSVFNAFTAWNQLKDEGRGTVFVDLGYSQTNVLISTGTVPRFMRLIQIGGKDIAGVIAEDAGISPEDAEKLKLENKQEDREKIEQATSAVLDELIKEMQLSFGYFENKEDKSIGDIYCSGGMTYQAGVVSYLQDKLGMQIKTWDPAGGLELSSSLSREVIDPVASQLAVSIGLAVRT